MATIGRQASLPDRLCHDGGWKNDESKWPEIQDGMIDAMARLEKALIPHLAKLKTDLASEIA